MTVSTEQTPAVYQLSEPHQTFGRMLWQLPGQYWRILSRPTPENIAAESRHANWGIVWFQLLGMAIFSGSVAILSRSFIPPVLTSVQFSELSNFVDPQVVQKILNASPNIQLGLTFLVTFLSQFIGFFLLTGSLHLVAVKFMGRQGSYLNLTYSMLLATVPLMLVTGSFGNNPYLAVLSAIAAIYMTALQTTTVMATYGLNIKRALSSFFFSFLLLAAVFLAVAVFFSLVIILGVIQII